MDGAAVSLHYDMDGQLTSAVTRGNGRVGDDVTEAIKRMPSVPGRLARSPGHALVVRGEVFMPRKAFTKINKQRVKVLP